MVKKLLFPILLSMILILAACGGEEQTDEDSYGHDGHSSGEEELVAIEVDFQVPETAKVNETVELVATVAYGDELVTDADEVTFEIWEQGDEENSIEIEATNNGDGTYSAETTFDKAGIFEMYAHTTARDMHTMPKVSITIEE